MLVSVKNIFSLMNDLSQDNETFYCVEHYKNTRSIKALNEIESLELELAAKWLHEI